MSIAHSRRVNFVDVRVLSRQKNILIDSTEIPKVVARVSLTSFNLHLIAYKTKSDPIRNPGHREK